MIIAATKTTETHQEIPEREIKTFKIHQIITISLFQIITTIITTITTEETVLRKGSLQEAYPTTSHLQMKKLVSLYTCAFQKLQ